MQTELGNRAIQVKSNPLDLRSAYEVQYRLDNQCPSVAGVLDFCASNTKEPYFVYQYLGTTSARTYVDKRMSVDSTDFKNWLSHGLHDVAECVAQQGMVTYDLKPDHMLIDPSGQYFFVFLLFFVDFMVSCKIMFEVDA